MAHIQPDAFDLIVIGTGMEEGLIAAGAAKCGKTVLHLDQAGHYGSAWSSLTLDDFLSWARQKAECTAHGEDNQSPSKQAAAADVSEAVEAQDLLHINVGHGQSSVYSNFQLSQQSIDLGSSRGFSLDLAGKVVYCASAAIDTMLAFGVHSYLEFKLFQGSYLYTGGKLTSVPASRAAVFKDRSLSPMDKRLLTRFLMQLGSSMHGNPFPQAAGSSPLVALLKAQGLSPLMRQYIMYAVAMADSDQEMLLTQQVNTTAHSGASATTQPPLQSGTDATPGSNTASLAFSASQAASQAASVKDPESRSAAGSLDVAPEASRAACSKSSHAQTHTLAAVDPASSADSADPQTRPDTSKQPSSEDASSCVLSSASPRSESQPAAAGVLSDSLMSAEQGLKALRQYLSSVGRYGPNSGAFLTPIYGCAELPQAFCRAAAVNGAVYVLRQPIHSLLLDPITKQCKGIQTDAGQVVRCSALAASASALQQLLHAPYPGAAGLQTAHNDGQSAQGDGQPAHDDGQHICAKSVSRAVCILDGPIQEDEPQLLITIPPNTAPIQNAHAIRIIQVGPAAAVCPANRHLLYMSTSSTATASEDLSRALSALVDTTKVPESIPALTNSASGAGTLPVTESGTHRQPEALLVAFYNQQYQQECDSNHMLPANVACCLPPDGSLDVDSAFIQAKRAFGRLYPEGAAVFEPSEASNDDSDSDDEALDALGDVLHNLSTA